MNELLFWGANWAGKQKEAVAPRFEKQAPAGLLLGWWNQAPAAAKEG